MNRKFIFFINPISGTKDKNVLKRLIEHRMSALNLAFEFLPTRKDADYLFLPAKIYKEKITDIIICGGDGTISQVAAALLDSSINIGIIPMGSGNGLALAAGISRNAGKALDIILSGKPAFIDGFYINRKFSCMLCGIGFDAQVAHDFARQKKRGLSTYIRCTIANFFSAKPHEFIIDFEDRRISSRAFFISIANSNQFGNHITIAPKATLTDGLLDIVVVNKMSKMSLLYSVLRQIKAGKLQDVSGKGIEKKAINYFQAKKLTVLNPSSAPLHIDGEPAETNTVFQIEIVENAFRLLQP